MAREKIIFINNIPLLFPERNVARQLKIEVWLDVRAVDNDLQPLKREDPTKYYIV
jgi:hypothetical protein